MTIKKYMPIIILLIISLLILPNVFSLGIAPAQRELTFQSQPQRYDIKIINNEKKDMDVFLSVDGVLAPQIKFDETKLSFTKEEDQKVISYTVTLPDNLEPGQNKAKIVAEEKISSIRFGESSVAAALKVVSFVTVNVPYPETFVDAALDVTSGDEQLNVKARVANKGTKDVKELVADFGLFDEEKKVTSSITKARPLKVETTDELLATFKTKDIKPGFYSAAATVTYDGNSLKLIKEFQIGKVTVNIADFDKYFSQNKINEFNVDVESAWNKEIKNAYAEVFVFRNGKEVTSFKGVSFDLHPEEKKRIALYFNTQGLELGDYDTTVVLHYDKETNKKEGKISVITKDAYETKIKEKGNDLNTYLFVTLIVLVVVFIFFIIAATMFFMKSAKK